MYRIPPKRTAPPDFQISDDPDRPLKQARKARADAARNESFPLQPRTSSAKTSADGRPRTRIRALARTDEQGAAAGANASRQTSAIPTIVVTPPKEEAVAHPRASAPSIPTLKVTFSTLDDEGSSRVEGSHQSIGSVRPPAVQPFSVRPHLGRRESTSPPCVLALQEALAKTPPPSYPHIDPEVLGPPIAQGTEKAIFKLPDRDGEPVVLALQKISGRRFNGVDPLTLLRAEFETLKVLAQHGIPTVKAHEIVKAGEQHGIVQCFIPDATLSSDIKFIGGRLRHGENLNARTIEDLEQIRQALDNHKLFVKDFQFLVDRQGKVHVIDPGGLHDPSSSDFDEWKATADRRVIDRVVMRTHNKLRSAAQ